MVKDSVNIKDPSPEMTNKVIVAYGLREHPGYVVRENKAAIEKFGEKVARVTKYNLSREETEAYAATLLHKSNRNHGFELELSLIGSPLFVPLVWCTTRLYRYDLFDNFFITRSNFKLSAGKAPTVDLSMGEYYPELKDKKDDDGEGKALD